MKWLYNPPSLIKSIFPNFIWESKSDKVLLTFDDGPVPGITEIILAQLQKYSVKSVFFCVGKNVDSYSSLVKEIISEGHTIANHTLNHTKINRLSKTERLNEIKNCTKIINEKLSYDVQYFRPPHGRFNVGLASELAKLNLKNVMWSLLIYDYENNIKKVEKAAESYLNRNSIVVLHDNNKSKNIISNSIDIVVETAQKKNYLIGTPEECLK